MLIAGGAVPPQGTDLAPQQPPRRAGRSGAPWCSPAGTGLPGGTRTPGLGQGSAGANWERREWGLGTGAGAGAGSRELGRSKGREGHQEWGKSLGSESGAGMGDTESSWGHGDLGWGQWDNWGPASKSHS